MAQQPEGLRIRIRLKAYDHKVIDQSAKHIIDMELDGVVYPTVQVH